MHDLRPLTHADLREGRVVYVTEDAQPCLPRGRNCMHRDESGCFLYCDFPPDHRHYLELRNNLGEFHPTVLHGLSTKGELA